MSDRDLNLRRPQTKRDRKINFFFKLILKKKRNFRFFRNAGMDG